MAGSLKQDNVKEERGGGGEDEVSEVFEDNC